MEVITIFLIIGSLVVGFGIGANSAANCLGTSVGAGIIDYKKALYLVAFLALIGAGLQGHYTMGTVGKGIVASSSLTAISILSIIFAAGILIIGFTIFGLPVSTTMSVIGSIAGIGILLNIFVKWKSVFIIFGTGFLSPIIAAIFGYIIYKSYNIIAPQTKFLQMEKILKWILLISGGFLAYSLGANDIGNAMGLVVGKNILTPIIGGFIGGIALAFGAFSLGKKVMRTVGRGITQLDPIMAFTSQLGAAATIYILTLLAIPTSTTFAIIGGIAGTGLVKGISTVDMKTVRHIVLGWLFTPLLGALLAVGIFKILSVII